MPFGASFKVARCLYANSLKKWLSTPAMLLTAKVTVVQWFIRRVALEEVAFFSDLKPGTYVALRYVDDPDVWHEALVTSPSLGVDRAAAILTPVAPVLLFLMTVSIASRPNGDLLCRVLEGGRRWLEADGDRPARGRYFLEAEDVRGRSQRRAVALSWRKGSELQRHEVRLIRWGFRIMQILSGC